MAEEKQNGFIVSQGRIALVLSVIALLTVFYNGAGFLMGMQYRIAALEESQKKMVVQIDRLTDSITELSMVLREVQVRQETK